MNLFKVEMKSLRKSLIFWSLGMIMMTGAGMSKYAALNVSPTTMNELMTTIPKGLQTVLGIGSLDVTKAIGFYGILYLYLIILATIHAALLGANILSKEERDKTTEFLYVKPVTRHFVITYKLIAALVNVLILNLVTLFISLIVVGSYGKGEHDAGAIFLLMVYLFLVQLIFLSLGTLIASVMKKSKRSPSLTTGILLITFFLSILIDLSGKMDFLKFLTPFKYFEAKDIINGYHISILYILLSFLLVALFTSGTYIFYKKRDLNI